MDDKPVEDSPIQIAQKRLADAAMGLPMNAQGAAMSAYVNGVLQSARIDALVELWSAPPNATWSKAEAYEAALLGALGQRAGDLEARAAAMKEQIAAKTSGAALSLPEARCLDLGLWRTLCAT